MGPRPENAPPPRPPLPGPQRIYVVRHGRSLWNATKRVSGQLDPPLSEEGRAQARVLETVLRATPLEAIYSSDLCRALETARPSASCHGLSVRALPELREQHLGVAQGRYRDRRDPEIQALWVRRDRDRLGFRIPGGETFTELAARVQGCLRRLLAAHDGGAILIVGHRNTNRVLLATLLGWPLTEAAGIAPRSRYLYEIVSGAEPALTTLSLRPRNPGQRYPGLRL